MYIKMISSKIKIFLLYFFGISLVIAVIYAIANPLTQKNSQTGLIVSKTVGNSVQRHKTSRQIRNVVQKMLKQIPNNIQIVIRALPKITEKDFSEIENILKLNILKSIEKANV